MDNQNHSRTSAPQLFPAALLPAGVGSACNPRISGGAVDIGKAIQRK